MSNASVLNSTFVNELRQQPLAAVASYYAQCLNSPDATADKLIGKVIDYLQRNALFVPASACVQVGFADRTFGNHIPAKILKAGKQIRGQLETLGIYRSNGREHFRGMVTVPLLSTSGEVTGLFGRRVDTNQGGDTQQHVGRGIFNAPAIAKFDELIVTENIPDAWALVAAGFEHAVCAVGTSLSIEELHTVQRVIIVGQTLDCEAFTGKELYRLELPTGMSLHQYCIHHREHRFERIGELLRAAPWMKGSPQAAPTIQSPSVSPAPRPVEDLDTTLSDDGDQVTIEIESRRWRIRGLVEASGLKLSVMVTSTRSDRSHLDSFDLVHARSRRAFTAEAAEEIGECESQLRCDLGRILLKVEEHLHQQKQSAKQASNQPPPLTADEQAAALELLRSENLLQRILADFEACGVVGETTGKLVGYLAATSRLLDKPLGLVIQSSSAAGKSSLAEAILRLMPAEACLTCSAMTSQSLYYLGQQDLQHKVLSIAEEEGVRDAAYQLKLLQSEGQLSLVASSKQKGSGRTTTERYQVQGPVALMLTTTSLDIDPELLNRCLVISIDESPTQTAAIHTQQRIAETFEAYIQRQETNKRVAIHQNAQRMLRRLPVFNPFARQLKFVGWETRHRRDHRKYLTLINTITLLHQYQREIKSAEVDGQVIEYLEVTPHDIALANKIADVALGRSIDELAEPTRRLLLQLYDWLRTQADSQGVPVQELTFTRRAARESIHWGTTQLNYHLDRLCRDEYVVRASGCNGKLCQYKLLFDGRGREGQPRVLQLVNPKELNQSDLCPLR